MVRKIFFCWAKVQNYFINYSYSHFQNVLKLVLKQYNFNLKVYSQQETRLLKKLKSGQN